MRLIPPQNGSGRFHMALDAWLLHEAFDYPVLRVYRLPVPVLSLGISQNASFVTEKEKAKNCGVEVTKRISGGKALLHDLGLTYTILVPRKLLPCTISQSYLTLSRPVFSATAKFKNVHFHSDRQVDTLKNSVCFLEHQVETICTADGHKIVGSAQKRNRTHILQHGEISLFPSQIPVGALFLQDQVFLENGLKSDLESLYSQRVGSLFSEYDPSLFSLVHHEIILEFEKLFGKSEVIPLNSSEIKKICTFMPQLEPEW